MTFTCLQRDVMLVSYVNAAKSTCPQTSPDWLATGEDIISASLPHHFPQSTECSVFPAVSPPIILCVSSMFDVTLTGVNTDANMTNQPHTSNTSSPPRAPGFPSEQMDVSRRHQPHISLPVCLQSMNQTADDEILSQTQWRAATKEARRSVCVQSSWHHNVNLKTSCS